MNLSKQKKEKRVKIYFAMLFSYLYYYVVFNYIDASMFDPQFVFFALLFGMFIGGLLINKLYFINTLIISAIVIWIVKHTTLIMEVQDFLRFI